MRVEVDQSGKVESTRTATVLAFSNETRFSILISAQVKNGVTHILKRKNAFPKPVI